MPNPTTEAATEEEETSAVAVATLVKRLLARLVPVEGKDPSDKTPLKVELTPPRRAAPAYVLPVPYHVEGEDEPPLPAEATAWLQVWEMDKFSALRNRIPEEGDTNEETNRLVCSIPGLVVRSEATFSFRALGDPAPTRSEAPTHGSILLELLDSEGQPKEHEIWLPEQESILELTCVLRDRVNDSGFESETGVSGILAVRNVVGCARRQIEEEGGLTLAFVPAYAIDNARNDPTQRNDAEFSRQAKGLLATRAAFALADGELTIGFHTIKGSDEIGPICQEVSAAAASALELSAPPKIATLLLFGHGTRTHLRLNPAGYRACGSPCAKTNPDFIDGLEPYLADEVTFALYACNNGRGYQARGESRFADPRYGQGLVGEIPGADSLAWNLLRVLTKDGTRRATVWAHTTSGHTTRNGYLRVFSSWGTADFANLVLGARSLESATVRHFLSRFAASFAKQKRAVALARLRNGNLLRTLSGSSARYLPWKELTGGEPDASDPAHHPAAAETVSRLMSEICGLLAVEQVRPECWSFEDASRRVLTGRDPDVASTERLSPHFRLEEFTRAELGSPLRLEVGLVQALELLRERGRSALKIEALLEGGAMVRLNLAGARQDAVLEHAQTLVEEGLLTGARKVDERLYVSTGVLEYDDELRWVTGTRDADAQGRITRSILWDAVSAVGKVRRSLCEAGQLLIDRGGTLAGVGAGGLKLRVNGPTEALVELAQIPLGKGMIDEVEVREDGVQLGCCADGDE
ncbi:MAG: hypothetical protein JKY65_00570 [Planctomycetes bacterium]|nr:hypothetical protein [Planctomycetota bacterium]